MRRISLAFLLLVTFAYSLCRAEEVAQRNARMSSRDVKVPKALVEKIEKAYKGFLGKLEGAREGADLKRSLINVNVKLTQKHHAALFEDALIRMPTGGGVIDLSDSVSPLRGAFNVSFELTDMHGEVLTPSRIFFVSHAKTRIVGGEEYGDGCGRFMEITTAYHKKWGKSGLEVYSADQRYLSVLGGTFLFIGFSKEALSVASVSFTDSRYPGLLCE